MWHRQIYLVCLACWISACAGAPSPQPPVTVTPPPPVPAGPATPTTPDMAPAGDLAEQGPFLPAGALSLCVPGISNPPRVDRRGRLVDYAPLIVAGRRVILAVAPVESACLNSGFGRRYGRPHERIDLKSRPGGTVFSGGPGIIREARRANGYGLYVVIDHGAGVYTRYAHLAGFDPRIRKGARIGFGQALGTIGRSGNATGVHLHYEVLTGAWGRRGSFGLTPHDPLAFPPYHPDLPAS